jgi:hypothetical protein
LENSSENNQSRGVLRLEKSEDVSNMILENSKNEDDGVPMYTVDNSELDDILGNATTTQADSEQQEKSDCDSPGQQSQKKGAVSIEEALKIAVLGLGQITELASNLTGKEIVIGEMPTTLFAVFTAPLIQKYKPKIDAMDVNPKNVDLDSWVPEIMAAVGVGVAAFPVWLQVSSEETSEVSNGD